MLLLVLVLAVLLKHPLLLLLLVLAVLLAQLLLQGVAWAVQVTHLLLL